MANFKLRYLVEAKLDTLIPSYHKSILTAKADERAHDERTANIMAGELTVEQADALKKVCSAAYKRRESGAAAQYTASVQMWKLLTTKEKNEDIDDVGAHVVEDLNDLVKKLPAYILSKSPGRGWVYATEYGQVSAYVITDITHYSARRSDDEPSVIVTFSNMDVHRVEGDRKRKTLYTRGLTVRQHLAGMGLMLETPELHEAYSVAVPLIKEMAGEVGKVYLTKSGATGGAVDAFDEERDGDLWYWRYSSGGTINLNTGYAANTTMHTLVSDNSKAIEGDIGAKIDKMKTAAEESYDGMVSVPYKLHCSFYDFQLSRFIETSVLNVEPLAPDPDLKSKLVLPKADLDLIDLLTDSEGVELRDIVSGKTGGIIVMCSGSAGLGKTATAEVYAAVQGRALYSVQCSQLGTDPSTLEKKLRTVLQRAGRWGAVLLLDEVDVYVRERGDNIDQNAVVGVFLRLLEYYPGLMFMTTNKPDSIDDAILSRCVAHIRYSMPKDKALRELWTVLSTQFEVNLSQDEISELVEAFGPVSGRSIKNMMKLTKFTAIKRKKKPDVAMVKSIAHYVNVFEKEPQLA